MIIINEDIAQSKKLIKESKSLLKGKIINNLLIIEDILDLGVINKSLRYKCVCRCLKCGNIMTARSHDIKIGKIRCPCEKINNKYKFRELKGKMLRFLVEERNRAEAEMLFEEDIERVNKFDTLIKFIGSRSLNSYFKNKVDNYVYL